MDKIPQLKSFTTTSPVPRRHPKLVHPRPNPRQNLSLWSSALLFPSDLRLQTPSGACQGRSVLLLDLVSKFYKGTKER